MSLVGSQMCNNSNGGETMTNIKKYLAQNQGFTLIELLIVIVIIVILAAGACMES